MTLQQMTRRHLKMESSGVPHPSYGMCRCDLAQAIVARLIADHKRMVAAGRRGAR